MHKYYQRWCLIYKYIKTSYIMGEEVITLEVIWWKSQIRKMDKLEFYLLAKISIIKYYLLKSKYYIKWII